MHVLSVMRLLPLALVGLLQFGSADSSISLASWMAAFPDSTPLTNLSMIGTHNSLSYNHGRWGVTPASRTQNLDINKQLQKGARYLDIRMRHYGDDLLAFHNREYLHESFLDFSNNLCNFLHSAEGRSEAVIVRLRREFPEETKRQGWNTRTWFETVSDFFNNKTSSKCLQSIWLPPNPTYTWPTLGEARGKMLIIEDFSNAKRPKKIPVVSYGPAWWDNSRILLQDYWKVITLNAKGKKLERIKTFFKEHVFRANETNPGMIRPEFANKLLLNHVSGSSVFAWPGQVARGPGGLNRRLRKWLCQEEGRDIKQLGVVIIDFLDEGALSELVIGRNVGRICN